MSVELTGLEVFDIDGIKKIALNGDYDQDSLIELFEDTWIRYIECHNCGRSSCCKYVEKNPYNENKLAEIKCGVVIDVLKNFVSSTFEVFKEMSSEKRQDYLDGAYHLSQFVYESETMVGALMNSHFVKYYGRYSPALFGQVTRLRGRLNSIAGSLKGIHDFNSSKGILFVEGWSEKALLDNLKKSGSYWFADLDIEVYDGKDNRRLRRISMLLDKYLSEGYTIYIQGDADGNALGIFQTQIQKGLIDKGHTFVFKHDLETSIPPSILFDALRNCGELESIERSEFENLVNGCDGSVNKVLSDKCDVNINSIKTTLAAEVGNILNGYHFDWINDEAFRESELGRFLMFVIAVPN